MSEDPNQTQAIPQAELAALRSKRDDNGDDAELVRQLQERHRELVHRVRALERDLLEATRRAEFERGNLLTREREIELERAIDRAIDQHCEVAVEVWRQGPQVRRRNAAATKLSGLSDLTLEQESLAELSDAIGLTRDSEGAELHASQWPMTRALQGETVVGEVVVVRGRRLLMSAYPLDLRAHGEAQLWAVVVYREVMP